MSARPKKSLGQNFLRDAQVIGRIVKALDLDKDDAAVEIGPGQGALTETLLAQAQRVTAIEFDRDLIGPLNERFGDRENFRLINADALTFDLAALTRTDDSTKLKLVANLPYNISTPILRRLIGSRDHFSRIVLMFQREVVERITAPPGGKERGYLTVLVENAFETEYLFDVPPPAFHPVPKVWSAVVRLTPKPSNNIDDDLFTSFLSTAFAHKRKTILNNLKLAYPHAAGAIAAAGIDHTRRAETLTLDEWKFLLLQIAQD